MNIIRTAILLFLVMDPFGNIPLVLAILKDEDKKSFRKVIIRELLFALIILSVFLFLGESILNILGISPSSLRISGGIVLLLIAIRMIFHGSQSIFSSEEGSSPFVVPIAVPSIAGPSAIATIVLMVSPAGLSMGESFAALLIAWVSLSVILIPSGQIKRILGNRGLQALDRLMGMLLTAISVEMVITGIKTLVHG